MKLFVYLQVLICALVLPASSFANTSINQQAQDIFHANVERFANQYELGVALNSISNAQGISEKAEINTCEVSSDSSVLSCRLTIHLKSIDRLQLVKFDYKVIKRDDGGLVSALPLQQIHVYNRVYSKTSKDKSSYAQDAIELQGEI